MNKISSVLLPLCLMCIAGLANAAEPMMDKNSAMERGAMSKDDMNKDGAMMMKAQPKKMKKPSDKMEQDGKMTMEPKK
jgi:hypothetical protein